MTFEIPDIKRVNLDEELLFEINIFKADDESVNDYLRKLLSLDPRPSKPRESEFKLDRIELGASVVVDRDGMSSKEFDAKRRRACRALLFIGKSKGFKFKFYAVENSLTFLRIK